MRTNNSDEWYTPKNAVEMILKYIPTDKTIWCPFDLEESYFVRLFKERGNKVIRSHIFEGLDFFSYTPPHRRI